MTDGGAQIDASLDSTLHTENVTSWAAVLRSKSIGGAFMFPKVSFGI